MADDETRRAGKRAWRGAVFAALGLLVCPWVTEAQQVRRAIPVPPATSPWDSAAKFLAGVPLPPEAPLAALQKPAAYREHSASFEKLWARYNGHYFTPMREWSLVELAPRIPRGAPGIYFFGGPDALAAMAYYPEAGDYLLGGLEPVGTLPAPESLDDARRNSALKNLRQSTNVILSFGHFITKDMKAELEATDFQGVLPLLLTFVAMSGGEVLDVCYFSIRKDGGVENSSSAPVGPRGAIPGVRVTFRRSPASAPQRIHYVRADVSNDALGSGGSVLAWASSFGRGNVYLKAASYLMHEPYFSSIRKFLLEHADSVLQDDSGIPLRYFQDGRWRCWFFGKYSGTLDLFKKYHQADLEKAFEPGDGPLPFGTGYKWRLGASNLMLAVPQAPPRAEPVSAPAE